MLELYMTGFFLAGAPAVLFVGPVLLTLLQASVQHGFRAGFAVAAGIAFSDVVCVTLVGVGLGRFFTNPANKLWFGIIGGCVVIGFGAGLLLSKPSLKREEIKLQASDFIGLFSRGFAINFANPFVFTYWIGALGVMASSFAPTPQAVAIYFGGAITVIFSTDVLKALLAERLKAHLSTRFLTQINRYAGIGLVLFGVWMLIRVQ